MGFPNDAEMKLISFNLGNGGVPARFFTSNDNPEALFTVYGVPFPKFTRSLPPSMWIAVSTLPLIEPPLTFRLPVTSCMNTP